MDDQKVTVFLGARSGSTRCKGKNFRPFTTDGKSLISLKIEQIIKIDVASEIIFSSNCENSLSQVLPYSKFDRRIKIIKRNHDLCKSDTPVEDFIKHVGSVSSSTNVMWVHATSPFIDENIYKKALNEYLNNNKFDSMFSVNKLQNFIWDQDKLSIINNDGKWVNTQSLKPLYEINHGFYLLKKDKLLKGHRIGQLPSLFICHGNQCIDIDTEDDFQYAQFLQKSIEASQSKNI
ncbi:hypothetical protein CU311_06845 [Prochlorococcus marinus str. MU1402]|uniref:acylneuraminate cytidylyltransferase family protein n=1 Tax=Prochlorococcus marinus TaxID=1219 RepID=UPI001ADB2EB1|nr:hypothetical protein [Prochlorococcus marinus]MBO8232396.1 hypothetical protein [Prochlorococcus marinus XMU1402]MBW3057124.1 hypothetical protein [Prochlorococcus marinus str. MU1402]